MESTSFDIARFLPLILPILLIQVGLQIYALVDLYRRERVKGSKWIWVLVIIGLEIFGPIIYFIFGHKENEA